jgi:hypothetical protein
MNHPFVINAARAILSRPEISAERDTDAKIERLERLIHGRASSVEDHELARGFLAVRANCSIPWQSFAQALLMANEFVFVD